MFTGICFIGLGIALLLGGLALIGSASSDLHEILGAVMCFGAWGLAIWGMVRYRLAAIGKAFTAMQAAQDAKRAALSDSNLLPCSERSGSERHESEQDK